MRSGGVPAGASSPYQVPDSTPESPASAIVGTSGSAAARAGAATARALRAPARACGSSTGKSASIMSIWPDSRSVTAGAAPR